MKKKKTQKKNYAFVDNANVTVSVARQGWHIDRGKLKGRLERRWNVERVFMLMGYHPDYEPMYEYFRSLGYELVFKPMNIGDNIELKGNIDTDLVLRVMKERTKYDKAILLTGDGDFLSLVKHLKEKKKLGQIIVPHSGRYSHFLDEAAGEFITSLTGKKRWLAYLKGSMNKKKGKNGSQKSEIRDQKIKKEDVPKKVNTVKNKMTDKSLVQHKKSSSTEKQKASHKKEHPMKNIKSEQKKSLQQRPPRKKHISAVQKKDQKEKTMRPQSTISDQTKTKRKKTSKKQSLQPKSDKKLRSDTKAQEKKSVSVNFPQSKAPSRSIQKKVVKQSSSQSGISFPQKSSTVDSKKPFSKPVKKKSFPKKSARSNSTKKTKEDPSHHTRFFD